MQSSREFNNIPIPPSTVPTREIKPLPLSGLFKTFEELEAAVQDHQRNNSAAVIRDKCSNYRTNNEGNRYPTTRSLRCDRGPRRRSEAVGLRQTRHHSSRAVTTSPTSSGCRVNTRYSRLSRAVACFRRKTFIHIGGSGSLFRTRSSCGGFAIRQRSPRCAAGHGPRKTRKNPCLNDCSLRQARRRPCLPRRCGVQKRAQTRLQRRIERLPHQCCLRLHQLFVRGLRGRIIGGFQQACGGFSHTVRSMNWRREVQVEAREERGRGHRAVGRDTCRRRMQLRGACR
jgi:hypothetical protein